MLFLSKLIHKFKIWQKLQKPVLWFRVFEISEGLWIGLYESLGIHAVNDSVVNRLALGSRFRFSKLTHLFNYTLVNLIPILYEEYLCRAGEKTLDLIAVFTHSCRSEFSASTTSLKCERGDSPFTLQTKTSS